MPKLSFAVVSKSFALDKDSNQLSIFEIFDGFEIGNSTNNTPAIGLTIPITHAIVCQYFRSNPDNGEKATQIVSIQYPDGGIHEFGGPSEINLEATLTARVASRIMGFKWMGPGIYNYLINANIGEQSIRMAEIPIFVKLSESGDVQNKEAAKKPTKQRKKNT